MSPPVIERTHRLCGGYHASYVNWAFPPIARSQEHSLLSRLDEFKVGVRTGDSTRIDVVTDEFRIDHGFRGYPEQRDCVVLSEGNLAQLLEPRILRYSVQRSTDLEEELVHTRILRVAGPWGGVGGIDPDVLEPA